MQGNTVDNDEMDRPGIPKSSVKRRRTFNRGAAILLLAWAALAGLFQATSAGQDNGRSLADIQQAAEQASRAGEIARAVALLDDGLKIDPAWKYGLSRAGLLLYQAEKYDAAKSYLTRLTAADSADGAGWALLGMCEFQLDDFPNTIAHVQRAASLGIHAPTSFQNQAGITLATAYTGVGDFDAAIELLGHLSPMEDEGRLEQIVTAFGFAAAHQSLKAQLSEEEAAVLHRVGEAYYLGTIRKLAEARAVFDALLIRYPKATALHYVYANLLLSWGEDGAAAREFRAELANDPASYPARLGLAFLTIKQTEDMVPEGLRLAEEAAHMHPEQYQPHFYFGQLLLRHDRAQEALGELMEARRLMPTASDVRYALAMTYRATGDTAGAAAELKEFKRLKDLKNSDDASSASPAAAGPKP